MIRRSGHGFAEQDHAAERKLDRHPICEILLSIAASFYDGGLRSPPASNAAALPRASLTNVRDHRLTAARARCGLCFATEGEAAPHLA
jgi:hypothetical protein